MSEEWKDIEGFEGIYQISTYGRVRSCDRYVKNSNSGYRFVPSQILSGYKDKDNYCGIVLYNQRKHKNCKVHQLVAKAFIPNPNGYREINHKDENPSNNNVDNLEWCDRRYNNTYNGRAIRVGITQSKKINQYAKSGELIKQWSSSREPQKALGYASGNIIKVCKGKAHTAYGYVWKYASTGDCFK